MTHWSECKRVLVKDDIDAGGDGPPKWLVFTRQGERIGVGCLYGRTLTVIYDAPQEPLPLEDELQLLRDKGETNTPQFAALKQALADRLNRWGD